MHSYAYVLGLSNRPNLICVGVIIYKLMGDSIITGSMAGVSGKHLRLSSHLEYSELVELIAQELDTPVQFFFGHKQVETNLTIRKWAAHEVVAVAPLQFRGNKISTFPRIAKQRFY